MKENTCGKFATSVVTPTRMWITCAADRVIAALEDHAHAHVDYLLILYDVVKN